MIKRSSPLAKDRIKTGWESNKSRDRGFKVIPPGLRKCPGTGRHGKTGRADQMSLSDKKVNTNPMQQAGVALKLKQQ